MIGIWGASWGIGGVLLLLGSAVIRLSATAAGALSSDLHWYHIVAFPIIVAFMAYTEGFRAFQQGFSPRVVARARYVADNPRAALVLLAPLFCMGFFHATRRRQITSFVITAGVIVLIVLVRMVPQPWRGIIDVGVVVGLAWGIVSLLVFSVRSLRSGSFDHPPEVPEG